MSGTALQAAAGRGKCGQGIAQGGQNEHAAAHKLPVAVPV